MKSVLGHYQVPLDQKEAVIGEGSFSVVQRGLCTKTQLPVAVKTYKLDRNKLSSEDWNANVRKFRRQIEVLSKILEPLKGPEDVSDPNLRHPLLFETSPKRCFLEILAWTKDSDGNPGPDANGMLCVVTELADYSLKDHLQGELKKEKARVQAEKKRAGKSSMSASSQGSTGEKSAAEEREDYRPLSEEDVRGIAKSFVLAMAFLHAKGLCHMDMKPENLMKAGNSWRVIDVDGCTPLGTQININDSSISFSPCYCSPEWASFLINDGDYLKVSHKLDVWSVAISLCELVALDAVLKPKYLAIYKSSSSHRKAGFLFLEWLSGLKNSLELGRNVLAYKGGKEAPGGFGELVLGLMLKKNPENRPSLAQCLDHPFLKNFDLEEQMWMKNQRKQGTLVPAARSSVRESEISNPDPPLMKGTLFKLDHDADPMNSEAWRRRDMWLSAQGSLCYFSPKRNQRVVLLNPRQLDHSVVTVVPVKEALRRKWARELVLKLSVQHMMDSVANETEIVEGTGSQAVRGEERKRKNSNEDFDPLNLSTPSNFPLSRAHGSGGSADFFFACENEEELMKWVQRVEARIENPLVDSRILLSKGSVEDFRNFVIEVRNRRAKIDPRSQPQFVPLVEANLWKLKSDGDGMKDADWNLRRFWVAQNGSLCYFSVKDQEELMYYRPEDVKTLTSARIGKDEDGPDAVCKNFAFSLTLEPLEDGTCFAPGLFAAEEEDSLRQFLNVLAKFQVPKKRFGRGALCAGGGKK